MRNPLIIQTLSERIAIHPLGHMVNENLPDIESYKLSAHGKPLDCPYCGAAMIFYYDVYYEGCIQQWQCYDCGLTLPNIKFTAKILKRYVSEHRSSLKRQMNAAWRKYQQYKTAYESYGKNNPSMRGAPLKES